MKNMSRRLAVAAVPVVALGATTIALASPASAYVGNCQLGYSSVGAYAHCSQGTSPTYRVGVWCQNIFTRSSRAVYGPWVRRGGQTPSVVTYCGHWYEQFFGTPWAQGS